MTNLLNFFLIITVKNEYGKSLCCKIFLLYFINLIKLTTVLYVNTSLKSINTFVINFPVLTISFSYLKVSNYSKKKLSQKTTEINKILVCPWKFHFPLLNYWINVDLDQFRYNLIRFHTVISNIVDSSLSCYFSFFFFSFFLMSQYF